MFTEIYIPIEGYESLYKISNKGNIKSIRFGKEKILKNRLSKNGYTYIQLFDNGIKQVKISRLVAKHFLGLDINNKKVLVCHKDDNPLNNTIDNLFLGTQKDNMKDCIEKGRFSYNLIKQ